MTRSACTALALLGLATMPLSARPLIGVGPLCRDFKGLAKPCPLNYGGASRGGRASTAPAGAVVLRSGGATLPAAAPASPGPSRRPLVGIGKLCHDSKGLAKPCR